jgi:hypothetical protein
MANERPGAAELHVDLPTKLLRLKELYAVEEVLQTFPKVFSRRLKNLSPFCHRFPEWGVESADTI